MNKKIIFVLDIPELIFDPRLSLDGRPFRVSSSNTEHCAYYKNEFESKHADYSNDVYKVVRDLPQVNVFDLSEYLCDSNFCWAIKNEDLLYRDYGENSHLSSKGSEYIGKFYHYL